MTTYDTGDVHHCTERPREDGTTEGCPRWPACLFATPPPMPDVPAALDRARVAALADLAEAAARREDWRQLGRDLASLAGWVGGIVLVIIVATILLPLLV